MLTVSFEISFFLLSNGIMFHTSQVSGPLGICVITTFRRHAPKHGNYVIHPFYQYSIDVDMLASLIMISMDQYLKHFGFFLFRRNVNNGLDDKQRPERLNSQVGYCMIDKAAGAVTSAFKRLESIKYIRPPETTTGWYIRKFSLFFSFWDTLFELYLNNFFWNAIRRVLDTSV